MFRFAQRIGRVKARPIVPIKPDRKKRVHCTMVLANTLVSVKQTHAGIPHDRNFHTRQSLKARCGSSPTAENEGSCFQLAQIEPPDCDSDARNER
jgi:hypothetical protein